MSTLNISSDIAYFFEQYDTLAATPSPLSTFALDFGTGLTDWVNATSIQLPITSISSTSIVASDGLDHSLTLSGSGFDPVTSAAALEAAISNGLANGSFTRIAIDGAGHHRRGTEHINDHRYHPGRIHHDERQSVDFRHG